MADFTCDMLSVIGWPNQLSMINTIFLSMAWNFVFKFLTHSSNKMLYITFLSVISLPTKNFPNVLEALWAFRFNNNKNIVYRQRHYQLSDQWSWFCCIYHLNIFPFSNDRICLVSIDETSRIHWFCVRILKTVVT